jgi:hypothetical protein
MGLQSVNLQGDGAQSRLQVNVKECSSGVPQVWAQQLRRQKNRKSCDGQKSLVTA